MKITHPPPPPPPPDVLLKLNKPFLPFLSRQVQQLEAIVVSMLESTYVYGETRQRFQRMGFIGSAGRYSYETYQTLGIHQVLCALTQSIFTSWAHVKRMLELAGTKIALRVCVCLSVRLHLSHPPSYIITLVCLYGNKHRS